ncbi:MAG TPA: DUF885 domain-containing protein [Pyrinomonadaceae bacterium]|jgi:uncharacterized protein (DUF885 family)|nr:DUF885 domain-containing protein [Pyrinomonadaceae bacterium]
MFAKLLARLAPVAVVALLLSGIACQQTTPSNSQSAMPPSDSKDWDSYVNEFLEAYFVARPDFAVRQGRHEFDGKLPDWSAEGFANEAKRLHAAKDRVAAFQESALSERQRFEREYIASQIDADLFWIESAEWPFRCPQFYADAIDPDVYVSREYAPLEQRLKAYTAYAKAVPTAVEQIRKNLRTPLPKTFVSIGHTNYGGLAAFYEKDVPAIFASVKDEQLQKDFKEANARAIKAMKAMDDWFKQQEPTATTNFALGAEKFSEMLKATERVDVPLSELAQIGRRDLDRNLAALKEACATFAPGASVTECVAKAQAHKPTGGAVEMARKQLGDLKAFINEKKLVTIPGPEEAKVAEAPAYRRWNFAYINIPGPYEKNLPSVYYIAPPDPAWSQKEKDAYVPGVGSLLFTSAHEVWPGHFLQYLHANRSPSKLGQLFVGYAFSEGWAHYTEEMMWDAGLGSNEPEMHVGQLLEALLRNVRFVSAIEMHTGKMTVEESEKMFLEEGYQDAANARQQAARGTFDPAYLNYTMGKLMIRKLRDDWTATRGGKQAWQSFHDEFLKYGGPPIPLVRKAMLPGDKGPLF